MAKTMQGGCACGRIKFSAQVENDDAYLCHCRMCQKATGSLSIAFKNVRKAEIAWSQEPDSYRSSPIAARPYCSACGTSLGFAFPDGGNMDLTVAAFDDPSSFRPTLHFGVENMHRAWLDKSGLPEKRTKDHAPLVERWIKATGVAPE